ncbi:MAG: hypothetical protein WBN07_12980 [Woeseiaceae bacterium]
MQALISTLFDIIRLRRGPEAIPYSNLLFVIIGMMWLLAGVVMTLATAELGPKDFIIGVLTGIAGLACYAGIVVLAGRSARLMQTLMALLGCGALLSFLFVAGDLVLTPLLSDSLSNVIVTLILLWTVPVEGHIISRAIERHWYIGVVMAMAVFVLQLMLYSILDPTVLAAPET